MNVLCSDQVQTLCGCLYTDGQVRAQIALTRILRQIINNNNNNNNEL